MLDLEGPGGAAFATTGESVAAAAAEKVVSSTDRRDDSELFASLSSRFSIDFVENLLSVATEEKAEACSACKYKIRLSRIAYLDILEQLAS